MWWPKKIPVVYMKNYKIQRLTTVALVIGTNFHFWDKVEGKVQPLGITLHFSELCKAILGTSVAELEIQRQTAGSQRAALWESHRYCTTLWLWFKEERGYFSVLLFSLSPLPPVSPQRASCQRNYHETWCSWASPLTVPAGCHVQTSVENRILNSESPSCCLVANFILKDYCSLVLVVPIQISVSAKPGNGVNGLPWMFRRRMSFMPRGALVAAAYNTQALWWPEKPEAGCHLSQLLYAPSFICFDVFQLIFPN